MELFTLFGPVELWMAHYAEPACAILVIALLIAAVIRGASRTTIILLCGLVIVTMTHNTPLCFILPFSRSLMQLVGWLLIFAYCMTLLCVRSPNGTSEPALTPGLDQPKMSLAAIVGLGIGIAANFITIWIMLSLLTVPKGAAIRPMGHVSAVFTLAWVSFFLGIPLSIVGCFACSGFRRLWCILGILFNLLVLPLGVVLLRIVAYFAGFELEG